MKPDLLQKLQRCFEEVLLCTSPEEKAHALERVKLQEPDLLPQLQTLLKQSGKQNIFSVPWLKQAHCLLTILDRSYLPSQKYPNKLEDMKSYS